MLQPAGRRFVKSIWLEGLQVPPWISPRAKLFKNSDGPCRGACRSKIQPDRHVDLRAAPTLGDRAQLVQCGRFGACHVHACPHPDRAALAMCALSPRVSACNETDLQPREGTDPSLDPSDVEIMIGKVNGQVSRSRTSNPSLLGPESCLFSLHSH